MNADFTASVLHPAMDTVVMRQAIDKRSETHSLNLTRNRKPTGFAGGGRPIGCLHIYEVTALSWPTPSRTPLAHQMRHAPSSETMQGPIGLCGVQALPYKRH